MVKTTVYLIFAEVSESLIHTHKPRGEPGGCPPCPPASYAPVIANRHVAGAGLACSLCTCQELVWRVHCAHVWQELARHVHCACTHVAGAGQACSLCTRVAGAGLACSLCTHVAGAGQACSLCTCTYVAGTGLHCAHVWQELAWHVHCAHVAGAGHYMCTHAFSCGKSTFINTNYIT